MVAGGEGTFTVTVTNKETVAAVLPPQEHWLPLSNLDLLLPPIDVGVFFCYAKLKQEEDTNTTNNDNDNGTITTRKYPTFGSMVDVLKEAVSRALVSYYAFAGEVVFNCVGEPEILCNNRGVDFFEARADVELKELNLYNPDQSVEGKLVPEKKDGVLAVQVTELKCGGIVVGCTFDHRVADAYSTNLFLVSWAEMAQSKAISTPPSFRRSLLNPRRPGRADPFLDNLYVPSSSLPPPPKEPQANINIVEPLVSRIYYVKANELGQLQALASSNGTCKRSKLESFSAFLWRMVAKSALTEEKGTVGKAKTAYMGIVVDGRSRLREGGIEKQKLMTSYFGNVLSIPYGEKKADELVENSLNWVANEVHNFLEKAVSEEHFLGMIDWVEAHRPEPAVAKIYLCGGSEEGPAFVVSSGQRFPVGKVDFGWGSPFFGSYHFPWGGSAGYVMPMPGPGGSGDWVVYMHLPRKQLEMVEAEAAKIFRPLTYEYLSLANNLGALD